MEELEYVYEEKGYKLRLIKGLYSINNAIYFGLIDDETKELYCDVSVNLHFSSRRIIELDNDFRQISSDCLVERILTDLHCKYLFTDYNGFCSFPVYLIG